jgi:hypothetical protein
MTSTVEPNAMRRDDNVVLQRPAHLRLAIPVSETPTACAGSAASYVLRRIAYRAGAYAPGIDDALFDELHAAGNGGEIDDVQDWLAGRIGSLHELGYPLLYRRIAMPTPELLGWIEAGRGYRGAVLATRYDRLHPSASPRADVGDVIVHAVGLALERRDVDGVAEPVMIDPWSRTGETRGSVRPVLELAHRGCEYDALAISWSGWS